MLSRTTFLREVTTMGDLRADVNLSIRTLIKTQDYLDVFARFKQKENIEAVERMLASHDELEYFERSQLGMFSPEPLLKFHS